MAVGGVVITVEPDDCKEMEIFLQGFPELTIYGSDEKGNIIGRIRGVDPGVVEQIVRKIQSMDVVSTVSLTYFVHNDDTVTKR